MAEGCLAVAIAGGSSGADGGGAERWMGLDVKSTCGVGFTDGADPSAVVVEVDLHGVRRLMLHA